MLVINKYTSSIAAELHSVYFLLYTGAVTFIQTFFQPVKKDLKINHAYDLWLRSTNLPGLPGLLLDGPEPGTIKQLKHNTD